MSDIVDVVQPGIPGPTGDVTPEALAAKNAAEKAKRESEAARDQAEIFAAQSVPLQDAAVAALFSDKGSESVAAASRAFPSGLSGPSDGSATAKVAAGTKAVIVCHGHSQFYGTGGDSALDPINGVTARRSTNNPVDSMRRAVAAFSARWEVNNQTRSGDSARSYVSSGRVTSGPHGDLHMFWFDSNADLSGSTSQLAEDWALIFSTCVAKGCQPVVIGGVLVSTRPGTHDRNSRYQIARAAARRFGAVWVDAGEIMAGLADLRDKWTDGTHLTDDAYAIIGTRLSAIVGSRGFEPVRVGPGSRVSPRSGVILGGEFLGSQRNSASDKCVIELKPGQVAAIPFNATAPVSPVVRVYSHTLGYGQGSGVVLDDMNAATEGTDFSVVEVMRTSSVLERDIRGVRGSVYPAGFGVVFVKCISGTINIQGVDFVASDSGSSSFSRVRQLSVSGAVCQAIGTGTETTLVADIDDVVNTGGKPWRMDFFVKEATNGGGGTFGVGIASVLSSQAGASGLRTAILVRRQALMSEMRLRRITSSGQNFTDVIVPDVFTSGERFEGLLSLVYDGTSLVAEVDGVRKGEPIDPIGWLFVPVVYSGQACTLVTQGASLSVEN